MNSRLSPSSYLSGAGVGLVLQRLGAGVPGGISSPSSSQFFSSARGRVGPCPAKRARTGVRSRSLMPLTGVAPTSPITSSLRAISSSRPYTLPGYGLAYLGFHTGTGRYGVIPPYCVPYSVILVFGHWIGHCKLDLILWSMSAMCTFSARRIISAYTFSRISVFPSLTRNHSLTSSSFGRPCDGLPSCRRLFRSSTGSFSFGSFDGIVERVFNFINF